MEKEIRIKGTRPATWALVIIYFMAILAGLICLVPLVNVLAISFNASTTADMVFLWPIEWSTESYQIIFLRKELYRALGVSILRVVLAIVISTFLTVTLAYPMSKSTKSYPTRKFYTALLIFCMLFNGGLVPTYLLVSSLLGKTIWTLILPVAVPIYNVILVMNFFRQLPKELEEAAMVDGAGVIVILVRIVMPLSMPVIATTIMFVFVQHWNDWFSGMLYISDVKDYPFQTFLQATIKAPDIKNMIDLQNFTLVSDKTIKAAQIFVGMIPMFILYPFVQKYFAAGIVLGAVKG